MKYAGPGHPQAVQDDLTVRFQLPTIDTCGDLRQRLTGDVHEKERRGDAPALREVLIRDRGRRHQRAAATDHLKRALLGVTAHQIDDRSTC